MPTASPVRGCFGEEVYRRDRFELTTNRMLRDYEVRFYNRLAARKRICSDNDFAVARETSPGSTKC